VRVLVLGGIRSGKSEWAEAVVAQSVAECPVRYLATGAVADDDDWSVRVDAHRARRPRHWSTVETDDVATQLRSADASPTLVDDVGGWLTAAMDRAGAWTGGSVCADIDDLLDAVAGFGAELVLVSPEVGLTVVPETAAGRRFADELGTLNQRLAALCDRVVLVVAGQPVTVKGPS
jgi:adenosylcobinamide kinase / adenosylcobinamide-phosphate guanylyltransferase